MVTPGDRDFWRSLGGSIVRITHASTDDTSGRVIDLENRYWQLMDEYGCDVIIKRPDHYIVGGCPSIEELAAVIADLQEQLLTVEDSAIGTIFLLAGNRVRICQPLR